MPLFANSCRNVWHKLWHKFAGSFPWDSTSFMAVREGVTFDCASGMTAPSAAPQAIDSTEHSPVARNPETNLRSRLQPPPYVPKQSKNLSLFRPPARRSDSARRRSSTSSPGLRIPKTAGSPPPSPASGAIAETARARRRPPADRRAAWHPRPSFSVLDLPAPKPQSKSPRFFWLSTATLRTEPNPF